MFETLIPQTFARDTTRPLDAKPGADLICPCTGGRDAFDPIAMPAVSLASHREPQFVFPDEVGAARDKLARFRERTGRRGPNILVILMDDEHRQHEGHVAWVGRRRPVGGGAAG